MKKTKFLVTGGAGFIGSKVVTRLLNQGYYVRVADDLSKKIKLLDNRADFVKADLTNVKATKKVFENIDICINAAAKIGGIGYFHKHPAEILSINNVIFSNTFDAAVEHHLKRMVYISSSMVFEAAKTFPSKEKDLGKTLPPLSAYGFSKLTGEKYCRAYWDQYRLPFSICRPFNAYGANEYPEEVGYAHVIPDLIKKITDKQYPLKLLGNGQQVRCFTHVDDLARGIVEVALSPKGLNEDFNIGTSEKIRMVDLAKKIWELMNQSKPLKIRFVSGFKHDVRKRIPDVTKINKIIGWKPEITLDRGLKEVIEWMNH